VPPTHSWGAMRKTVMRGSGVGLIMPQNFGRNLSVHLFRALVFPHKG
jgi:hypothetical protein